MTQKTAKEKPDARGILEAEAPVSRPEEALPMAEAAETAEEARMEGCPKTEAGPEEGQTGPRKKEKGGEGPRPQETEPEKADKAAAEAPNAAQALPPPPARRTMPLPKAYISPLAQARSLSYAQRAAIYLSDRNEYRQLTGGSKQWK